MDTRLTYGVFRTTWGWVGALASPEGLRRLTLPGPSAPEALRDLGPGARSAAYAPESFQTLADRLNAYFAGSPALFEDRLDLDQGTEFERSVWEAAGRIPFGETRAYGWVAERIGRSRACRAVGRALGRNPLPLIIPCHRVVGSDGSLCGYGGGLPLKKRLLDLEARGRAPSGKQF